MADASGKKSGMMSWLRDAPAFANQVMAEKDKVTWPTRQETVRTAIMVVIMTMLLGIFFFAVDWGFSRIVRILLKLA